MKRCKEKSVETRMLKDRILQPDVLPVGSSGRPCLLPLPVSAARPSRLRDKLLFRPCRRRSRRS